MHPARRFVLAALAVSVAAFAWHRLFPPPLTPVVEVDLNLTPATEPSP